MRNTKISLFLLMCFTCSIASATDYYISATGNNSNNGLSQSTPWQTLSKLQTFCNNGTIHAGDNIYFKKGDSFTGTLLMTSLWGYNANSGTASQPITFTSYGTGAKPLFQYPQGGTTRTDERIIMQFIGVDYVVVDGFNFTDLVNPVNDKFSPANCGFAVYLGIQVEATSNHCTIKNIDVSLCGMGIAIVGDYNTVTNSSLTNFKDLINTDNGGYDDFGANALTITGSYNEIVHNYISGAWAYSADYGWNGGACEMYNTCNGNKIMYNTFVDCEGISEYGGVGGTTAANNMIAYNKIINCGTLTWINTTGTFAMQASNVQYFNNVIVENNLSRFSGPNTGAGNNHPIAQYPSPELFAYSGTPNASTVFNLKNNIFYLGTGIDVVRTSCAVKTTHQDNLYRLSGSGTPNVTLGTTELSTMAIIFTNTAPADPVSWNFSLPAGSPAIDFGQNVGIPKDFAGNTVPAVPNAGILEATNTAPATFAVTATSTTILCNGGTAAVTVTATGGVIPYTGTGTFTVNAGSYTYTVTDGSGSIQTASVTVIQPSLLTANAVAGTIAIFGGSTNVTTMASGGTSPYSYSINGGIFQALNTFSVVPAGSYVITVKDARGCTTVKNISITQPAATTLSASYTNGTINCNGASTNVTVTASGGAAPYTGTGTFTVFAGTYSYTVIDASGSISVVPVTITQPVIIEASVNAPNVTTSTDRTTATVTASGGTPTYTYNIDAGTYQASNIFNNVAVGTHSIRVKDLRGCIITKTFIVSVAPTAPLTVTAVKGFIICYGGSASVTISASGGVQPYTGTGIFIVSAGTRNYTVSDATGATVTKTVTLVQPKVILITVSTGTIATYNGRTTATISATGGNGVYSYKLGNGAYRSSNIYPNIAAGNYTLTVKDTRNCTSVKSFTVLQPAQGAFQLNLVSQTNLTCRNSNNGTITVSGFAGTLPYRFKTNNGSYSSSSVFTSLSPGNYTITGKDATGSTASISVFIANSQASCISGKGSASDATGNVYAKHTPESSTANMFEAVAFPNPSSNQFSLLVNSNTVENIHVTVINLKGQKVYEDRITPGKKVIFGNTFIPGIYLLKIMQANKLETIKVVKTK
ncbi:MAG: T9SS type A sorting domain-containing protein [Ferruginibacter sp.]|nr:T9SS type A sorting domain-containing protein [Ferruginibacter sp.]